jgi:hypothetical protein
MLTEIELSAIANEVTSLLNSKFEKQFNDTLKKIKNLKLGKDLHLYFDEVREEIFGKNLAHYVYIIFAKNNCICGSNHNKYCYSLDCVNKKYMPLIQPSNFSETNLKHKKRKDKSVQNKQKNKKSDNVILIKEKNKILYLQPNSKKHIEVHLNNLFKKHIFSRQINELGLTDILLFDRGILDNIFKILESDLLNNHENSVLNDLIIKFLTDKLLLEGKLKALHNLFEIGDKLFPSDFDVIGLDKFKDLAEKIQDYIDTTYGAGIFYLRNTRESGFVSLDAIKQAFKEHLTNKSLTKFTKDHIYRRKLAANHLKNESSIDFSEFSYLYRERFAYISYVTSGENKRIISWDKNPESMKIDFHKKFKQLYKDSLRKLNVFLIKTQIESEANLNSIIHFMFLEKIKKNSMNLEDIDNIQENDVQDWFDYYNKFKNIF